jgi:hypothetical protein
VAGIEADDRGLPARGEQRSDDEEGSHTASMVAAASEVNA